MATSNLLESLANVVAYAEKNLKIFLFLVFVTDFFVINNWPMLLIATFPFLCLVYKVHNLFSPVSSHRERTGHGCRGAVQEH